MNAAYDGAITNNMVTAGGERSISAASSAPTHLVLDIFDTLPLAGAKGTCGLPRFPRSF
jgi:hypothetical protein